MLPILFSQSPSEPAPFSVAVPSSRVALLIVLQSFNQLDDRYGQEVRKNILSNSVTHLLLPGSGLEETEYYSQRIGNSTIKKESTSTTGYSVGLFSDPQNITHTQDETGRCLLMSDEIRTRCQKTPYS
ncbi:TraM recognition domain-containing protein [Dictyobacter kobayashii]|uniref:TraM recognition domain-containing protein n=1 Tax=Dictyobacter kobayashii TaxID=2014872 RepID=UPI000F81CE67